MKNDDVHLERLFAAARLAAVPEAREPMPAPLQTRVLARWRAQRGGEEGTTFLLGLFRRALICAGVLMLVAAAWSFTTPEEDYLSAMVNYELRTDLIP